jgi:hypothetical protein
MLQSLYNRELGNNKKRDILTILEKKCISEPYKESIQATRNHS